VNKCKPLIDGVCAKGAGSKLLTDTGQGFTLVHVRAQLEHLQDTFMR